MNSLIEIIALVLIIAYIAVVGVRSYFISVTWTPRTRQGLTYEFGQEFAQREVVSGFFLRFDAPQGMFFKVRPETWFDKLGKFFRIAVEHLHLERQMPTEAQLATTQCHQHLDKIGLSREVLDDVLEQSIAQKKGLAIYLSAQVIHAIFVRRLDENTIELRNQTSNRVIVRCDRIDAISIP